MPNIAQLGIAALALLANCTSAPPEAARESFTVTPQTCVYDLQAPLQLAGSIPTYYTPGVDCVPPEGGDVFSVGFGWAGGVLRFSALRPLPADGVVELDAVSLYVRTADGWCVDWSGYATVKDGDDWDLSITATCTSGPLQVVADFRG